MTKFTKQNIIDIKSNSSSYKKIHCDKEDLIISELDWQKRGLQQTVSGYGSKLTTRYYINFERFNYRVYCRCFSNSGTCYIKTKRFGEIVIDAI